MSFDWTEVGTLDNEPPRHNEPMKTSKDEALKIFMAKHEKMRVAFLRLVETTERVVRGCYGPESEKAFDDADAILGRESFTPSTSAPITDAALEERWGKLLIAESVIQEQRAEIIDALNDQPPETWEASIRKILGEQIARPSPDYRSLLLKARREVLKLAAMRPFEDGKIDPAIASVKELMRLTRIEGLPLWNESIPYVAAARAIESVVMHLKIAIEDPGYRLTHKEIVTCLEDAITKPEEFLERLSKKGRDKIFDMTIDEHAALEEQKAAQEAGDYRNAGGPFDLP